MGVWIGRPLLGQWVWDIIRRLDHLETRPQPVLVASGPMSVPAMSPAAARHAGCRRFLDGLSRELRGNDQSAVVGSTHRGDRAEHFGDADVPHLAGLVAPRPLVIARGV